MFSEVTAAVCAGQGARPLLDSVKPILGIDQDVSCLDTLMSFLRKRRHMAMVLDPYGGVAGLLTLEDLLETLLGAEIVDERDVEVDMRKLARRKRSKQRRSRPPEPTARS